MNFSYTVLKNWTLSRKHDGQRRTYFNYGKKTKGDNEVIDTMHDKDPIYMTC